MSLPLLRLTLSRVQQARTSQTCAIKQAFSWQQTRGMRLYKERTIRIMYWRGRSFDRLKLPDPKRSNFIEWNYRSEIFAFSRRLQENLSEVTLRRVFATQSYVDMAEQQQIKFDMPSTNIESNTDLIKRGDQLLDECIKPYLRYIFSKLPEEGISNITSYLKSEPVMADIAKWFGCKDIILVSEWPPSQSNLAGVVRALLAGIETDLGSDRVQRFVVDMIISYLNDKDILDDIWIIPNPQETLNMILANSQLPAYEPRIMFQTGIKTVEACHLVGLYTNQKFLGSSAGETLEIAEHCAALDSLQRIFDLTESRAPFVYGEASEKINYQAHQKAHHPIKTYRIEIQ